MPTAMASENNNASISGRDNRTLMTKIDPVSTPATRTRSPENRRSPSWNSVSGSRSPRPSAMRPNSVCAPVATTRPCAAPARTIVPMNAHDDMSGTLTAPVTGREDFAAGNVSPVRTASPHSSPEVSSSRTSAGTTPPSSSCTRSPGTSSVTSSDDHLPSRRTTAWWRICECRSSAANSARYSLKNPRPMLNARIPPMISASARSPRKNDNDAVISRSKSSGLRS